MFDAIRENGFPSVANKLLRAEYFLRQLKRGGFEQEEWLANLDGFFFEIISARVFFFQAVNDKYELDLRKSKATDVKLLTNRLQQKGYTGIAKIIESIGNDFGEKTSRLYRIANYRNSATHRELLKTAFSIAMAFDGTRENVYLFRDPENTENGWDSVDVRDYCQQSLEMMGKYLESKIDEINCA